MSVKQIEKGKWLVQVRRAGMKRVRKTFCNEKQAREFERDYVDARSIPDQGNADGRSIMALIDIWFRYHGHTLSDGIRLRRLLDAIATDLGNPIACKLTPEDFLEFRYRRTVTDRDCITPKTFNNHHGYLNAVYRKLLKLKIIDYTNPIDGVDMVPVQERQLGYLSESQIETLFNALKPLPNEDVKWIAEICIRTGARWGEAEKLTLKQLHNNRVTFEFTKSKRIRTVPLDPDFFKRLIAHVANKQPHERIFINGISSFRRSVARAGIELPRGQMTHALRHTFASYFIMRGGNILTLQSILGHADIKMTMRYAHLAPDHAEDAIKLNPMVSM